MSRPTAASHLADTLEAREWWREAVTMALYVSLSLLAVLVALPQDSASGTAVLVTAIALLLAHQVAFRMSTRLVNRGLLDAAGQQLLGAQLLGGLAIALVAALPIYAFGADAVRWSELALLVFVGGTGYLAARQAGRSPSRALLYVALVVGAVVLVVAVKGLTAH